MRVRNITYLLLTSKSWTQSVEVSSFNAFFLKLLFDSSSHCIFSKFAKHRYDCLDHCGTVLLRLGSGVLDWLMLWFGQLSKVCWASPDVVFGFVRKGVCIYERVVLKSELDTQNSQPLVDDHVVHLWSIGSYGWSSY